MLHDDQSFVVSMTCSCWGATFYLAFTHHDQPTCCGLSLPLLLLTADCCSCVAACKHRSMMLQASATSRHP